MLVDWSERHPWSIDRSEIEINYRKENYVDEEKKEARTSEPEEVIAWLNHGCTLHYNSCFLDPQPQSSYDHLQLGSNH